MSILSDLRRLFEGCPLLAELTQRVDALGARTEEYGIYPAGSSVVSEDMAGAKTWQYNFVLQAERMTVDDLTRLENSDFIEQLQDWVEAQNRDGVPLSGEGVEFISISAGNGAIVDWDDKEQYGTYKVQCTMIIEKEG